MATVNDTGRSPRDAMSHRADASAQSALNLDAKRRGGGERAAIFASDIEAIDHVFERFRPPMRLGGPKSTRRLDHPILQK